MENLKLEYLALVTPEINEDGKIKMAKKRGKN